MVRPKRTIRSSFKGSFLLLILVFLITACGGSGGSPTATQPVLAPTTAPASTQPTVSANTQPAQPANTSAPTMPADAATATAPSAGGEATPTTESSVPTDTVSAFPDPGNFTWAPVVSGLTRPVALADPGDGAGRLLVLEQAGTIRVIQAGSLLPEPFLDISDRVGRNGNEQGLLGIALHPNYAQNGYFYVNYTGKNGNTHISRFSRLPDDPNRADPNSEKVLLTVDQPFANHNGGIMTFGPDGYLYMGLGDGGSAGDPHGNGQSLDTLLGKILRVDVDSGDPYAIPAGNPFASGGDRPEIWMYGLRNPWRFSFDRLTGDMYIADVGQNQWEEIDFHPAGAPGGVNYGWNYREGLHPYKGTPPAGVDLVDPVFEYSHSQGCSVTGGYVYRGQSLPEFRGVYLFADYCSGKIWGLLRGTDGSWQNQELFQSKMAITSFGQDRSGELYLMDQNSGGVYRLQRK